MDVESAVPNSFFARIVGLTTVVGVVVPLTMVGRDSGV